MKKTIKLASIGDCCADIYPSLQKTFPGGTAYNVAAQATLAGAEASIISAIGNDHKAEIFHDAFRKLAINASRVAVINGNTSSVEIILDPEGKPTYDHWDLGVLKEYTLREADYKFIQQHDVARVVLFKPLAHVFEQFCHLKAPQTLKAADFAGSSTYSEGIEIIKHSIQHLDIIIKSIGTDEVDALEFLKKLAATYPQKLILILQGEQGSIVLWNGNTYHQSAIKGNVVDTNGAGDAYIAHFLTHYAETRNIAESMSLGAIAATKTINHLGAVD